MSKQAKLLEKLKNNSVLKWDELATLLKSLGFELIHGAGSRRKFWHQSSNTLINLHQPHPQPELKRYQKTLVLEALQNGGFLS